MGSFATHLAVHRRRSEAELLDEGHEGALLDAAELVGGLRRRRAVVVVALLGLLLRHHRAVIRRSCGGGTSGISTPVGSEH